MSLTREKVDLTAVSDRPTRVPGQQLLCLRGRKGGERAVNETERESEGGF